MVLLVVDFPTGHFFKLHGCRCRADRELDLTQLFEILPDLKNNEARGGDKGVGRVGKIQF